MNSDTLTSTQSATELDLNVARVLQLCRADRLGLREASDSSDDDETVLQKIGQSLNS